MLLLDENRQSWTQSFQLQLSTFEIYNPFRSTQSSLIDATTSCRLRLTECIVDIGSKVLDCIFQE